MKAQRHLCINTRTLQKAKCSAARCGTQAPEILLRVKLFGKVFLELLHAGGGEQDRRVVGYEQA
jgi:hypothetical protein